MQNKIAKIIKIILLIFGAFLMVFPFVWMLATSLKTLPEATQSHRSCFRGSAIFTCPGGLVALLYLFEEIPDGFAVAMLATLVLTVLSAYAFTIFEFYGKKIMFFLRLVTTDDSVRIIDHSELYHHFKAAMGEYVSGNDRSDDRQWILHLYDERVFYANALGII